MIEESFIVKDTRKIRYAISERFDNNSDLYIDYLLSMKTKTEKPAEYGAKKIKKERLSESSRELAEPAASAKIQKSI